MVKFGYNSKNQKWSVKDYFQDSHIILHQATDRRFATRRFLDFVELKAFGYKNEFWQLQSQKFVFAGSFGAVCKEKVLFHNDLDLYTFDYVFYKKLLRRARYLYEKSNECPCYFICECDKVSRQFTTTRDYVFDLDFLFKNFATFRFDLVNVIYFPMPKQPKKLTYSAVKAVNICHYGYYVCSQFNYQLTACFIAYFPEFGFVCIETGVNLKTALPKVIYDIRDDILDIFPFKHLKRLGPRSCMTPSLRDKSWLVAYNERMRLFSKM